MIWSLLQKTAVTFLAYLEIGFNPQGKNLKEWETFAEEEMNKSPSVVNQLITHDLLRAGLADKYYLVRQEPLAVTGLRFVGFFIGAVLSAVLATKISGQMPLLLQVASSLLLTMLLGRMGAKALGQIATNCF